MAELTIYSFLLYRQIWETLFEGTLTESKQQQEFCRGTYLTKTNAKKYCSLFITNQQQISPPEQQTHRASQSPE